MKIALVVLCLVGFTAPAHADVAWWQQFYARMGYRTSAGLADMSSPTLAIGYRIERASWGLDLTAFDVQQGLDEGVHELSRVSVVRSRAMPGGKGWVALGAGYSIARGWAESDLPRRRGHGVQLGLAAGYDVSVSPTVRGFGHVGVGLPLYTLHDDYQSMDSSTRVVPIDVAAGVRF